MSSDEFTLEIVERAADTRRDLCGARKTRILAEAQVRMYNEEIACYQDLIRYEREAQAIRQRGVAGCTGRVASNNATPAFEGVTAVDGEGG